MDQTIEPTQSLDFNPAASPKPKSVFRLRTSCWSDGNSIHVKKTLTRLKRLSIGDYEHLLDEAVNIGAYDTIDMITNLHECQDGLYVAKVINVQTDWETGITEDWEYKLIPYALESF